MLSLLMLLLAHVDPEGSEPPTEDPVPATPESPLLGEPADPTASSSDAPSSGTRETVVRTPKARNAASSTTIRDRDLVLRPHPRPADILQTVPGFYVVQHSGGGKANQYFLRGFDADHGTDVLLSVDGVPVNMPSHGHGQGYADLHWVIPELVKRVDVKKGPYFADVGDFATAGAIDLVTVPHLDTSSISVGTGAFLVDDFAAQPLRTSRALLMVAPEVMGAHPFFAAEVYATDGPFENREQLQRFNVFARAPLDLGESGRLTLSTTSYGGGWNGSGQLPVRAVKAGKLDRFGTVDATEGGTSQRHSLVARFDRGDGDESLMISGYLTHYRFTLYSNFTFFSADQERGDQIEQTDVRNVAGLHARYSTTHSVGPLVFDTRAGVQMRNDLIENGLFHTQERERLEKNVDANVAQGSVAVYGEEEIALPPMLRLVLGVRADGFGFQVDDNLDPANTGADADDARTSGVAYASVVSPKASLIVTFPEIVELYVNAGYGFHSNDARGTVRSVDAVSPLTRALGYEVGARTKLLDRIDLAGSLFGLDLDGETVWVGDEGVTELRGPTRRLGVEVETRAMILPWLFADLDATTTSATFVDNAGNGDAVALAPTLLVSGGVSVYDLAGFFGRLGVVHVADRPATEDRFFTAEGFVRFDGTIGWRTESLEIGLDVQNLGNTAWREAQFANVSRLRGETAASCTNGTRPVVDGEDFVGCEDVHFTPGAPLNAQLTATFRF